MVVLLNTPKQCSNVLGMQKLIPSKAVTRLLDTPSTSDAEGEAEDETTSYPMTTTPVHRSGNVVLSSLSVSSSAGSPRLSCSAGTYQRASYNNLPRPMDDEEATEDDEPQEIVKELSRGVMEDRKMADSPTSITINSLLFPGTAPRLMTSNSTATPTFVPAKANPPMALPQVVNVGPPAPRGDPEPDARPPPVTNQMITPPYNHMMPPPNMQMPPMNRQAPPPPHAPPYPHHAAFPPPNGSFYNQLHVPFQGPPPPTGYPPGHYPPAHPGYPMNYGQAYRNLSENNSFRSGGWTPMHLAQHRPEPRPLAAARPPLPMPAQQQWGPPEQRSESYARPHYSADRRSSSVVYHRCCCQPTTTVVTRSVTPVTRQRSHTSVEHNQSGRPARVGRRESSVTYHREDENEIDSTTESAACSSYGLTEGTQAECSGSVTSSRTATTTEVCTCPRNHHVAQKLISSRAAQRCTCSRPRSCTLKARFRNRSQRHHAEMEKCYPRAVSAGHRGHHHHQHKKEKLIVSTVSSAKVVTKPLSDEIITTSVADTPSPLQAAYQTYQIPKTPWQHMKTEDNIVAAPLPESAVMAERSPRKATAAGSYSVESYTSVDEIVAKSFDNRRAAKASAVCCGRRKPNFETMPFNEFLNQ